MDEPLTPAAPLPASGRSAHPSANVPPHPARAATAPLSHAAEHPVVLARGLRKVYDTSGHQVIALDGVDLEVPAGRFLAIMGASGSGKSTLLHVIGGLTPPTAGVLRVEGQDIATMSDRTRTIFRRRRLGIVFQEYNLLPTLTARENVALPLLVDGQPLGAIRERADALLRTVHLEQRAEHRPDALSGGEQQRVAIARALLNDPVIILADEPTGNLDSRQSQEIWALLRRICNEQRKTILMVTHEAHGAAFADHVIVLKDGRVVGNIEPKGSADAALVANRYQELAG
jgi:putative ABC transport system ATP-binding protein